MAAPQGNPQLMNAMAQMMFAQQKAGQHPPGPPGAPPGAPPMGGPPHPPGPPGMPPPGMPPPGPPGMMPPGGPPPMAPPGGMPGMGMQNINPMMQPGLTDMNTNYLNMAASQLNAYLQNGPMDENKAQVAQALQVIMRVMTGGTAMPSGAIHGSVTMPNPPPDPNDFQIPNAPSERL